MNAKRITYGIIIIMLGSAARSYAQTDSTHIKMVAYLTQYLKTDTTTAGKALAVQESYKKQAKQVLGNSSLTDQQKRAAIDALIDEKNGKLKQLLTPGQLSLLVPTAERRRNWQPDTTTNKTH